MQDIRFDSGMQEYTVNGKGKLRFNPTDPALYVRYMAFYEQLGEIVKKYSLTEEKVGSDGLDNAGRILAAASEADRQVKQGLAEVFGAENDFDALLDGVNVLATTDKGTTVAENLLDALLPVVKKSAAARQKAMEKKAAGAKEKAAKARATRAGG